MRESLLYKKRVPEIRNNKAISTLEKLGLSNYEARAYLAAVSRPPMTGYKLAQMSGVPRSRIYETIERLITKGLLIYQSGEKILLASLDFKSFLEKKESEYRDDIGYLKEYLSKIPRSGTDAIWNINGRDQVIKTALDLIGSSKKYVYIEVMAEDLLLLKKTVRNLHENKIPVYAVYCGENRTNIAGCIQHMGECRLSCNEIAVVVDGKQSLIGVTQPDDGASAALTQNRGVIHIVEEYIRHEIFLNSLFAAQDKESVKLYRQQYRKLMRRLPTQIETVS